MRHFRRSILGAAPNHPPLREVLQGNITELGAWEDEASDFADDLAWIRLKILERQSRHQESLYLAEAEGRPDRYLHMLAKLGRTEEAIAQAQQQMSTPGEALALAQTLREQGELEQALHPKQRPKHKEYSDDTGNHSTSLSDRLLSALTQRELAELINALFTVLSPELLEDAIAQLNEWD
jgi:hypothetical protein